VINSYPGAALALGLIVLAASGVATSYLMLAVAVSDGPGRLTAQLMLAFCIAGIAAALLLIWLAASALLKRL
jgi:hypothetical protein